MKDRGDDANWLIGELHRLDCGFLGDIVPLGLDRDHEF